jgi:hypothetical protein
MPVIEFGLSATPAQVLDLIEGRVSWGTGLPKERIFTYVGQFDALLRDPPAEKFAAVVPEDFPLDAPTTTGGGAEWTRFNSRVVVHVAARLATDREKTDVRVLRDASRGFVDMARKALRAVHLWYPTNPAGTASYLIEPARATGLRFNPRNPPAGWGWAAVTLDVKFRTDNTLAEK